MEGENVVVVPRPLVGGVAGLEYPGLVPGPGAALPPPAPALVAERPGSRSRSLRSPLGGASLGARVDLLELPIVDTRGGEVIVLVSLVSAVAAVVVLVLVLELAPVVTIEVAGDVGGAIRSSSESRSNSVRVVASAPAFDSVPGVCPRPRPI